MTLDLYLIAKDPFKPQKERTLTYGKTIVLAAIFKFGTLIILEFDFDNKPNIVVSFAGNMLLYLMMWYFLISALLVMRD